MLVEADRVGLHALVDLVADQRLAPVIDATFPLSEAGKAQETKPSRGKNVLTLA
ncbi:hypothetical protein [Amycolatopsis kentuckyensis]|uniref:hypothetical protein n=1 Tax=Amycolatopsis kentuckyensis TaxID=218823 RepID=UPI003568A5B6